MRSILFACSANLLSRELSSSIPSCMLPVGDRPLIQHCVEYLVDQGVRAFEIVVSHQAQSVESHLGNGSRWGCSIRYHLVRDPYRPYGVLHRIKCLDGDPTWVLGHADCLPLVSFGGDVDVVKPEPVVYLATEPTGELFAAPNWAIFRSDMVTFSSADQCREAMGDWLFDLPGANRKVVPRNQFISLRDHEAYLSSQHQLLDQAWKGLLVDAREIACGVWVGRHATIGAGVVWSPPVFIGECADIGQEASIGPYAVVGAGSIVSAGTRIRDATLLPGTYVGEGLRLNDVLVAQDRIIRPGLAPVSVPDGLLLGDARNVGLDGMIRQLFERGLALLMLAFAFPLLVAVMVYRKFGPKRAVFARRCIRIPTTDEDGPYEDFLLVGWAERGELRDAGHGSRCDLVGISTQFLPGLVNVVKGDLQLVGLPPRSIREVRRLPREWREVYLKGHAGLITEAATMLVSNATSEERFMAERYHSVVTSWRYDVKLLLLFIGRAFGLWSPMGISQSATELPL